MSLRAFVFAILLVRSGVLSDEMAVLIDVDAFQYFQNKRSYDTRKHYMERFRLLGVSWVSMADYCICRKAIEWI